MNFSIIEGRRARRGRRSPARGQRKIVPTLMPLEARELLAAGSLGVNIGTTMGYVDLVKESTGWDSLTSSPLATDGSGWPLGDARLDVLDERVNQPWNGYDAAAVQADIGGTYHLSFQGQATVSTDWLNNYAVQNQVYNAATNTTTADLVVPANAVALLYIDFRNTVNPASSSGAGVADVKLIQPGYAANTTQVFTSSMIGALAPFSTIRDLNVDGANNYGTGPLFNDTYQTFTTPSIPLTAGAHVITFEGLGNTAGDVAAFLDNVQVISDGVQVKGSPTSVTVGDPSFEADQVGSGAFAYTPQGTPWTFAGGAGVSANGSAFTSLNVNAPAGQQVAFLQNAGSISQSVSGFAAGSYHLTFQAMQRDSYKAQSFEVLVDGKVVGTYSPVVGQLSQVDWSQRKLPDASSQVVGPGAPGEAWEYMIALANATNTDLAINIPGPASDAYIAQLANLIKYGDTIDGVTYAGLNSNLKVDLEYSNEVWGGIYGPFIQNYDAAIAEVNADNGTSPLNNDGSTNAYEWSQRYYLQRTMQATNIFRSVLGSDPTFAKVRPVLGSGEGNFSYFTDLLPWFEKTYGPPSQYFYGIGSANYLNSNDSSSVDNEIASLTADLAALTVRAENYTTVANYYGLHNVAYEGGIDTSYGATTSDQDQVALAASYDPRMEQLVSQLYTNWYAAGGDLAEVFNGPFGIATPYNQYPLVQLSQENSPSASAKYRGVLDLAAATPPAITTGIAISATAPTSLPVSADTLGLQFSTPVAGEMNFWLLNVPTAGNYQLVLQAGAGASTGQVAVTLGDQDAIGTFTVAPSGTVNLGTLALHAGLNTLGIATQTGFVATSLTVTAPVKLSLTDTGFEADHVPTSNNAYVYQPTGTAWTFAGTSGVSANYTAFTNLNPAAPEGYQVAFVQGQGAISQTTSLAAAGSYQVSFQAALRAGYAAESLQVLVDGVAIGTLTPSSASYMTLTSAPVTLAAGPHTVTLQGMTTADGTAFVDTVSLVSGGVTTPLVDSGFESDHVPTTFSSYVYQPTGTAWTYAGTSGVSANNTGFTWANTATPEGYQVAFVQDQGAVSQLVSNWTAGSYTIGFDLAQRASYGTAQTVDVLVDGVLVGAFGATGTGYTKEQTATFTVKAGAHTIAFQGASTSGDATAFLDDVSITQQ